MNPLLRTADLWRAIDRRELRVAVQPIVELRTGRVTRVEALCRWTHATHGAVAPPVFVALAEEHGLITPLTLAVIREVGEAARPWRVDDPDLRVSVNLSLIGAAEPDFEELLLARLRETRLPPEAIGFEVTETALMAADGAPAVIDRLRGIGCRVDVDDFGTGYSSLARLADLPLDGVKVDRQFVSVMARDHKREAIVRAAIALAHDLGLAVTAEGVEGPDTWELLRALGCDEAQGYRIARPMPVEEFAAWRSSWDAGVNFGRRAGLEESPLERAADDRDVVLVVDDEPVVTELLREILEAEGFSVATAANGHEALRAIETRRPAVILLDMRMPGLDGPGLARDLRSRDVDVPIVVMTAGPSAGRFAEELNADAFVSKPFDMSRVIDVTSRYAKKQRLPHAVGH